MHNDIMKSDKLERVDRIFNILYSINPTPKTELIYTNDFTLLVAVVLSARMTDKGVNNATKHLFLLYDTPQKMLSLGESGLSDYIKTIGLYKTKSKNIIALSKRLIDEYCCIIPNSIEALMTLPGVGRKTANVVLNILYGIATMPVDTHVSRVAQRLGLVNSTDVKKIEKDLMDIIPKKWIGMAHHWMVLHGRYICKSRHPRCDICPINMLCELYNT